MSDPMTDPIDRLRLLHRRCPRPNCADLYSHCDQCGQGQHPYPCDVVAALDELEERDDLSYEPEALREFRERGYVTKEADALQARLDAATVLIRQAMATVHILHFVRQPDSWHDLAKPDIDTCPNCAPYRAWLEGDKEEHSE